MPSSGQKGLGRLVRRTFRPSTSSSTSFTPFGISTRGTAPARRRASFARLTRTGWVLTSSAPEPAAGGRGPCRTAPSHGNVVELLVVAGTAQEEPAPAHVAAPHERRREEQPRAEHLGQHVHVFAGGDAAQEHDLGGGVHVRGQHLRVAQHRLRGSGGRRARCPPPRTVRSRSRSTRSLWRRRPSLGVITRTPGTPAGGRAKCSA